MRVIIYLSLLGVCCLYAYLRGGAPERWGAAALVAAVIITPFAPSSGSFRFQNIEWGVLAVDTTLMVAIAIIAVRAQRFWPMWMAAILMDTVLTHLLKLSPKLLPWSYGIMSASWSYPIPIILAVGAWRHHMRKQRYGDDPAWNQ